MTVSVVIAGAPGALTSTGRPNFPRVSRALRGALRSRVGLCRANGRLSLMPEDRAGLGDVQLLVHRELHILMR